MYFCNMIFRHLLNMRSHPTWVRGLKLQDVTVTLAGRSSHPTWVRGLKLSLKGILCHLCVAPYVGAWIETSLFVMSLNTALSRTLRGCVD